MRRDQLERLALICPACRAFGRPDSPLALAQTLREDGDEIVEGALQCSAPSCLREHPIIDGIPVVVADLIGWAAHQLPAVMRRADLSPWMTSLLGDAAGPGSPHDADRKNIALYASAHYAGGFGDLVARVLETPPSPGTWLDVGCSTGGGTFALARAGASLAIGVDLSFGMLRVAERARRTGVARFERRRIGVVYEQVEAELADHDPSRVAFVCADATRLPFAEGAAAGALAVNIIDCVADPIGVLVELARAIADGARAVVATPYDWAPNVTPLGAWLGGHSQRAPHEGRGEVVLRAVLGDPQVGFAITAEHDRVTWRLPIADRAAMEYQVHVLDLARRRRG